jgi:hypothetical protein
MTDNDHPAAGIAQHRRADVASMRALGLARAVLAAQQDGAATQQGVQRMSKVAGGHTPRVPVWPSRWR